MKFTNYTDARIFFQSQQNFLTVEDLRKFIAKVETLLEGEIFLKNRETIVELIVDAEHQIDLLSDTELLKHAIRNKNKSKRQQRRITVKQQKDEPQPCVVKYIPREESTQETDFSLELGDIRESTNLVERVEKELYEKTIQAVNWNKAKMARVLGVTDRTVYHKLTMYEIPRSRKG